MTQRRSGDEVAPDVGRPPPITILRVIARMNVGGPALQISALTRHLDGEGFQTILVTGGVDANETDFITLRDPSLPVVRLPNLGRSLRVVGDVMSFVALIRLIRVYRPDIIHTHTAKAGVLGRLAAVVTRVPIRVHTFHGHLLHGYFGRIRTRLVIVVERVLGRMTTQFVTVGARVRDDLLAVGIGRADRFSVIPPGVTIPRDIDRHDARRLLGLPDDVPIAVFIGRVTRIKRLDRLLEAWRQVLLVSPDAVLVIAGGGDELEAIRTQASDLGSSVRFLGWVADPALVNAAADVAVLTSDNEGMSVSVIKAAMAARPAVTTDVGSAREVVADGETGFVVPTDPRAVADALVTLLSDHDLRRRLGDNARQRAERLFGVHRLVDDHRQLYERLVVEHGRATRRR